MQWYEYRVLSIRQHDLSGGDERVTHVNGQWTGQLDPDEPGSLSTCPTVWDYLDQAGREGWELVGVRAQDIKRSSLYLKRTQ